MLDLVDADHHQVANSEGEDMDSDEHKHANVEGMTETVEIIPNELHESRENEQDHSDLEKGEEDTPNRSSLPSSLFLDQEAHVFIFYLVLYHNNIITATEQLFDLVEGLFINFKAL